MKLYDGLINEVNAIIASSNSIQLSIDAKIGWEMLAQNELVLAKHSAYELGADGYASTCTSLATTDESVISNDRITLIGPDLCDIRSDVAFARIMIIHIDDVGEDAVAYKAIRDIEFVKYDMIPRGYMHRTSFMEFREQVRVAKSAVANGISFSHIGSGYISKLHENPSVKNVHVIFISKYIDEFDALKKITVKADCITKTLNHVLTEMNFDCKTCTLKSICDEVEGLRDLHFKKRK